MPISALIYIVFVCYSPILSYYFPEIMGISFGWILFFALAIIAVLEMSSKKNIFYLNEFLAIVMLYSGVRVASVMWSSYTYDEAVCKVLFMTTACPVILIYIGFRVLKGDQANKYLLNISNAIILLSLIAVFQHFLGIGATHNELRASATLTNANGLAILIVLSVPALILAHEQKLLTNFRFWMYGLTMVAGLIATVSRKGMISFAMAYLITFLLLRKFKYFISGIVIVAILGTSILYYDTVSKRFTTEDIKKNITGRSLMVMAGIDMFTKKPLYGFGYRGYYKHFYEYFRNPNKRNYDAHNMYVTVLSDYGLLGFIPFMLIFLYPLRKAYVVLKKFKNPESKERQFAVLCIASIVPFMFNGYFAGGLYDQFNIIAILYSNIIIFINIYNREENDRSNDKTIVPEKV